ncbi:MAG: hypothetical protein B6242_04905 [Anaerolineaceae bacterium 4572_78]|nr:MAG: hypothetical protein B6242_04905 [Anaerolineaceae bacterium 4572_78]
MTGKRGVRTEIYLTIDIYEARVLTDKGLSGRARLPKRYEISTSGRIPQGVDINDEVILIVSYGHAFAFVDFNEP